MQLFVVNTRFLREDHSVVDCNSIVVARDESHIITLLKDAYKNRLVSHRVLEVLAKHANGIHGLPQLTKE